MLTQPESGRNLTPNKKLNARQRALRVGAFIGIIIGGPAGWFAHNYIDNQSSPGILCGVAARTGDTLDSVKAQFSSRNYNPNVYTVFEMPADIARNPNNTPDFYVNGSMGLDGGDTVVLNGVSLGVCITKGGVPEVTPDGNLQAAQRKL
jgi:hypothetical protein